MARPGGEVPRATRWLRGTVGARPTPRPLPARLAETHASTGARCLSRAGTVCSDWQGYSARVPDSRASPPARHWDRCLGSRSRCGPSPPRAPVTHEHALGRLWARTLLDPLALTHDPCPEITVSSPEKQGCYGDNTSPHLTAVTGISSGHSLIHRAARPGLRESGCAADRGQLPRQRRAAGPLRWVFPERLLLPTEAAGAPA